MNLTELADQIHLDNKAKGFYDTPTEKGTRLMMVVGELGEAMEAIRKDRKSDLIGFENRRDEIVRTSIGENPKEEINSAFEHYIKDTEADEIADAIIRLLDYCGAEGIDIQSHIEGELSYNRSRPYKHGKKM